MVIDPIAQHLAAGQLAADTRAIQQEYPDIFRDDALKMAANVKLQQIAQRDAAAGRFRPALELYREAGNKVRELMQPPAPQAQQRAAAPLADPEEAARTAAVSKLNQRHRPWQF